jgi:hypothetical protein
LICACDILRFGALFKGFDVGFNNALVSLSSSALICRADKDMLLVIAGFLFDILPLLHVLLTRFKSRVGLQSSSSFFTVIFPVRLCVLTILFLFCFANVGVDEQRREKKE